LDGLVVADELDELDELLEHAARPTVPTTIRTSTAHRTG
jgi:hypothetical protein